MIVRNFYILICTVVLSYTVQASSNFMNKNIFLGLSIDNQILVIEEAQKIVAEIEETQKKFPTHVNEKKHSKAKYYAQTLISFMISSAHAKTSLTKKNICIYAGWMSYMHNGKCIRPSRLKREYTILKKQKKEQLDPSILNMIQRTLDAQKSGVFSHKNKCKKQGAIVCAPHLYGYEDQKSKKPFCGSNKKNPYNASIDCSRKVSLYLKDDEDKKRIHYKAIIQDFSEELLDTKKDPNQSSLIQMFTLFHDVCACKGEAGRINQGYAEKMFLQRTCYSWLKQNKLLINTVQSQEVFSPTCAELDDTSNPNFKNFFNWLSVADSEIDKILINGDTSKKLISLSSKDATYIKVENDKEWASFREAEYLKYKDSGSCKIDYNNATNPVTIPPATDLIAPEVKPEPDKPEEDNKFEAELKITEKEEKKKSTVLEVESFTVDGKEVKLEDAENIRWFRVKKESKKKKSKDKDEDEDEDTGLSAPDEESESDDNQDIEITFKNDSEESEIEQEDDSGLSANSEEKDLTNEAKPLGFKEVELSKKKNEYEIYATIDYKGKKGIKSNILTVSAIDEVKKKEAINNSPQLAPLQQGNFIRFNNTGFQGVR